MTAHCFTGYGSCKLLINCDLLIHFVPFGICWLYIKKSVSKLVLGKFYCFQEVIFYIMVPEATQNVCIFYPITLEFHEK